METKEEKRTVKDSITNEHREVLINIIDDLCKSDDSVFFREPIDLAKTRAYDYFRVVAYAMDLGTIKKNLIDPARKYYYVRYIDFIRDGDLVWKNCVAYNRKGSPAARMGLRMQQLWEAKLRDFLGEEELIADVEESQ